jgi:hypothetical protein
MPLTGWQRLQEEDCEANQEWRAAKFHLDRMLLIVPADESIREKLPVVGKPMLEPAALWSAVAE